MKYEIANPSDKCFFNYDNELIAAVACLILGRGYYGLKEYESGKTVLPILMFGGVDEWLEEKNINALAAFINEHKSKLAACFQSFSYDGERTSMTDIGESVKKFAEFFSKEA